MTVEASDPFELVEKVAQRQAAEERLAERIGRATRQLIFGKDAKGNRHADFAFWATLALQLKPGVDWECPTACTDGERVLFNPEFVESLSDQEVVGLVAHEVGHCSMAHFARMGCRDPETANEAMDLALNPILAGGGITLPACRIMPGESPYADIPNTGLSFEEIYNLLLQRKGKKGNKSGKGPPGDLGGCGSVKKAGDGTEAAQNEAKANWEVKVAQAHQMAKQRGKLSAGLDRFVSELLQPSVDWKEVLREFITKNAKSDYKWNPPNRRYVHQGLYLPGRAGHSVGDIIVGADESGSMGQKEMTAIASEIQGIIESYEDVSLTVLHHDSEITHVQEWDRNEGPFLLEPKGGGGTSHIPVFEWIDKSEKEPACVVLITDGYSCFPDKVPSYPVLWCTTTKDWNGPFGQTIEVKI